MVEPYVQKTHFDVDGQQATMNYPIVLGNDELAEKFGGLIGFPTTIVISRDGKVQNVYRSCGSGRSSKRKLRDYSR